VLKNSGSLIEEKKTWGCDASQAASEVVPHFGAPIMNKLGLSMISFATHSNTT
jgi:hypothetical protein